MNIVSMSHIAEAAPVTAPVVPAEQAAQNREVVQAVKAVNASEMYGQNNELRFQRDAGTKRMVIRVVDRRTDEVLEQLPPEYVLELASGLRSKPG